MDPKFTSYNAIQLAGEESFLRWLWYKEEDERWKTWLSSHPTMDPIVQEAKRIANTLSIQSLNKLAPEEKDALWAGIKANIQERGESRTGRRVTLLRWSLVAAATFALVVWINTSKGDQNVMAKVGQQKEIVLPDQSKVTLNAGTYVYYNKKTFLENRTLYLEGEAFFTVEPGSTFAVNTSQGEVTVLGTSFNVVSRSEKFEVKCYTGKVGMELPEQDSIVIQPGEKGITTDGQQIKHDTFAITSTTPEWTTGRFIFDNQPLSEVLEELERQYDVKIKSTTDLDSIRYTGLFESGDLDKALSLVTWPLHLTYTKKGKTITIAR